MDPKLRVAYVSAEVSPYAKSGESADVASSLSKYLSCLDIEVSLFLPRYRRPEIESLSTELVEPSLLISLGDRKIKARVFKCAQGKYDIYFVDNPKYFWRENIFGTGKREYLDNDERFVFFSRAVLEFLLSQKMAPDIIHCNNWPTAMIPVFLKTHYSRKRQFRHTATVFTLHNIAYQGEFPPETLAMTGLSWDYFSPKQMALNGKFNFLKAGVLFSDVLNTVSSSYKREILAEKHGSGLEEALKGRMDVFYSIRNGIDYEIWDPERDPYIAANYSSANLKGKKKCKRDLIDEFGLTLSPKAPLIGFVSFLSEQKGVDILLGAVDALMQMNVGLVVLGQGEERYEQMFLDMQRKHPGKLAVRLEMNPPLSHKVVAGADIFLIPSLYEPCGLNQLYSFRYATVPVVRATGGLVETVRPFDLTTMEGNGFVFKTFSSRAMLIALKDALKYYGDPKIWQKIVREGIQEDFSWEIAARKYLQLYQKALAIKRGG